MTPEQAVYSAAFTQALAAVCGLQACHVHGVFGLTYSPPTAEQVKQARAWATHCVDAWHTVNKETP